MAALLLSVAVAVPVAAGATMGLKWGMNVPAVSPLASAGAKPDYAKFWVGVWSDGNWGSVENRLRDLRAREVTPVIQWYYWGDDISPDCVENGCWSDLHNAHKSKGQWFSMAHRLAEAIDRTMGGREVIVVLETEFNKGGIDGAAYAPTFDAYLERHNEILHGTSGVKTVVGFGSWRSSAWDRFPRAVESADYTGFQAMRSSVRESKASYLGVVDSIERSARTMSETFPGTPIFITDMAFSSYPEPEWADYQDRVIRAFFLRLPRLKELGVEGFMYRSLTDVNMDTNNYHGEAERWWGFLHRDGTTKPAYASWMEGVTGPPEPAEVPGRIEAERMRGDTGASVSDGAASNGRAWNLWSNGRLTERVVAEDAGTYRFTITARGSPVQGTWSHMTATLDGAGVGDWSVNSREYRQYGFSAFLHAGEAVDLEVHFTNDKSAGEEDRNLIVDRVDVAFLAPPNTPPSAAFDWQADGRVAHFDASATRDPDGDDLTYRWDFGDGATATGAQVTHRYDAGGTYTARLTVSDAYAEDRTTREVRLNRPPVADFTMGTEGLTVRVDASAAQDPDGDTLTYKWNFGDGRTAGGRSVTHTYASGGTRAVTLVVSDGDDSDALVREAEVRPRPFPERLAAQHFAVKEAGQVFGDKTARGGDAWNLWDNAALRHPILVEESGEYVLTATARGQAAGGVEPRMEIRVDGRLVRGADVPERWTDHPVHLDLEAGREYALSIAFVNDYHDRASGEDRNVHVDHVTLRPATAEDVDAPLAASFTPRNGNPWWLQVDVDADRPLAGVDARVDGGPWVPLTEYSWGWARDAHAPEGSVVTFRARAEDGTETVSDVFAWPSGRPVEGADAAVTFQPRTGHAWWVQADVSAPHALAGVDARVDGGEWVPLHGFTWGWARVMHVPEGASVEFRARDADGSGSVSRPFAWNG